jgi:hypothetical protein
MTNAAPAAVVPPIEFSALWHPHAICTGCPAFRGRLCSFLAPGQCWTYPLPIQGPSPTLGSAPQQREECAAVLDSSLLRVLFAKHCILVH